MKKQPTFLSVIRDFEYKHDLRTVFDDFLTMSICAMGQNPMTGKSFDEDLYLQIVAKYKDDPLVKKFPELYAHLVNEMDARFESSEGYDVLGEFYEQNLSRKGSGQFFTPWPICMFMAKSVAEQVHETKKEEAKHPLRILDPSCGSARMLMAAHKCNGPMHEYYGIDIDHTCVKMAVINLFLSGMFHSEVLNADALVPEDFRVSYKTSFLPMGIFKIQEKEKSRLWYLLKNSWDKPSKEREEYNGITTKYSDGSQLHMF